MTKIEAVKEIIAGAVKNETLYKKTLRSTIGVHNPGTRGALVCQAAEQSGRMQGYINSLCLLAKGGLIPEEITPSVLELLAERTPHA